MPGRWDSVAVEDACSFIEQTHFVNEIPDTLFNYVFILSDNERHEGPVSYECFDASQLGIRSRFSCYIRDNIIVFESH